MTVLGLGLLGIGVLLVISAMRAVNPFQLVMDVIGR